MWIIGKKLFLIEIFYHILKNCAVSRRFFFGFGLHANHGIRMESSRTRWAIPACMIKDIWRTGKAKMPNSEKNAFSGSLLYPFALFLFTAITTTPFKIKRQ
ncbi:hypothetical protein SETIT_4G288200v2 [Setaria italica]|uniref:Uncharacterized protein n=1 Tax=Setaria italica TaxID=4555 RepID=A0A368QZC3_SETIT|nr:hypothetical protein SETIT_4G288200v2 [Setaria italica]